MTLNRSTSLGLRYDRRWQTVQKAAAAADAAAASAAEQWVAADVVESVHWRLNRRKWSCTADISVEQRCCCCCCCWWQWRSLERDRSDVRRTGRVCANIRQPSTKTCSISLILGGASAWSTTLVLQLLIARRTSLRNVVEIIYVSCYLIQDC